MSIKLEIEITNEIEQKRKLKIGKDFVLKNAFILFFEKAIFQQIKSINVKNYHR